MMVSASASASANKGNGRRWVHTFCSGRSILEQGYFSSRRSRKNMAVSTVILLVMITFLRTTVFLGKNDSSTETGIIERLETEIQELKSQLIQQRTPAGMTVEHERLQLRLGESQVIIRKQNATIEELKHSTLKTAEEHNPIDDLATRTMIAYISQGPAKNYEAIRDRFHSRFSNATFVFFYHSYDQKCVGCLFQKATSFAEGKNLLIRALIASPEWEEGKIKYVISFDDDVPLVKRPFKSVDKVTQSGWQPFHQFLLKQSTTHPFIKPRNKADPEEDSISYQSCTDENFWGIRYDHLDFIYPHTTYGQEHFHLNALKDFYLFERCFPAGFMVLPLYRVYNLQHRYDTKDKSGVYQNHAHARKTLMEMLERDYPSLGPWKWHNLDQRCNVRPMPPIGGVSPICKSLTEDRFQRWIAGDYEA